MNILGVYDLPGGSKLYTSRGTGTWGPRLRLWHLAGVRFIFNPNAIVKAEFSHNGEYGGVPSIPDDVVTTSAVMAF